MRFHFFFMATMIFFSCQESQSATSNSANTTAAENKETSMPKTVEAKTEKVQDLKSSPQAKATAKVALSDKSSKIKIEQTPSATQQADINKIIQNATATKPIAIPKGTAKPQPKKEAQTVEKKKTQVVSKKETTKRIAIEATQPTATSKAAPQQETKISHASFDNYLKKYVSRSGSVDYSSMKSDYQPLKDYLGELAKSTPKSDWSRDEKLAYWINAYNAFTIDLILSNYPVSKITDLDGGSPWKVSRIELEEKKYSLDQIENKIIRPQFQEPRIHFAVNCAAKSCPTLMNGAFLPSKLSSQLEQQTKKFINNSSFNKISEDSVEVSKIFEWYSEDFGNLKAFLNKYSTQKIADETKIEFIDYDWSLNGK